MCVCVGGGGGGGEGEGENSELCLLHRLELFFGGLEYEFYYVWRVLGEEWLFFEGGGGGGEGGEGGEYCRYFFWSLSKLTIFFFDLSGWFLVICQDGQESTLYTTTHPLISVRLLSLFWLLKR